MLYTSIKSLKNTRLTQFNEIMWGCDVPPSDLRDRLKAMPFEREAEFRDKLPKGLRALVSEALTDQEHQLAAKGTRGLAQAARYAYVLPRVHVGDGHASVVLTFAPAVSAGLQELVKHHRLARFVLSSFVGGGASFTDAAREAIVADSDGKRAARNVARPLPEDVIAYNARLFAEDAPLAGLQLLGNNSWGEVLGHFIGEGEGIAWHAVVMVTTRIHSQDGLVVWLMAHLPEHPQALTWVSIHAGEHPIPTADTVNAFLAPLLLHPAFQRGMMLAGYYPTIEQKFGEVAPQLLLNPRINKWFVSQERHRVPRRRLQSTVLGMLDKTGGLLLADARLRALRG